MSNDDKKCGTEAVDNMAFMACKVCIDAAKGKQIPPTSFVPIVEIHGDELRLVQLICSECKNTVRVNNGFIEFAEEDNCD